MVTSGEIDAVKQNHDNNMDNVKNTFTSFSNIWEGTSYTNLNEKVTNMANYVKTSVDHKMELLKQFSDVHHNEYKVHSDECDTWRTQKRIHSVTTVIQTESGPVVICCACHNPWQCAKYIEAVQNIERLEKIMREDDIPKAEGIMNQLLGTGPTSSPGAQTEKNFENENWVFKSTEIEQV